MKVLGIIPARYASSRFPGKPLAEIGGKPMVQWVYEKASRVFDNIYVATDDDRISKRVEAFGGKCLITSAEHKSGTDRCAEALALASPLSGIDFDVVVNIQGDEPFIAEDQLRLVVKPFDNDQVQIATLAKPFAKGEDIFNPNTPKLVVAKNGKALYFSRSAIPFVRGSVSEEWVNSHTYLKHIGLYAYRSKVLLEITKLEQSYLEITESLEQLRWLENGYSIHVKITNIETQAVDTPEDLEKVRLQVDKLRLGY